MTKSESSAMFERSMLLILRRAHAELDRRGVAPADWFLYRQNADKP